MGVKLGNQHNNVSNIFPIGIGAFFESIQAARSYSVINHQVDI